MAVPARWWNQLRDTIQKLQRRQQRPGAIEANGVRSCPVPQGSAKLARWPDP
jgi:hypothetical protein